MHQGILYREIGGGDVGTPAYEMTVYHQPGIWTQDACEWDAGGWAATLMAPIQVTRDSDVPSSSRVF